MGYGKNTSYFMVFFLTTGGKMKENLTWITKEKTQIFNARIMEICNQSAISPDGEESHFIVVEAPDWVITIPVISADQAKKEYGIDEECFLMVSQWRHGSEELSIEFPGGVIERGEDPSIGAKRELREETGYAANDLIHLSSLNPNPAIFKNTLHIFLAKNLTNTHSLNLDHDEYVGFKAVPVREVITSMGKKPYTHALMSTALLLYIQNEKI